MKTQTTGSTGRCPLAAVRYARVLHELNVPKEAVGAARGIFAEEPRLYGIYVNPTISLKKKMDITDRVFPEEIRNFLKVVCRYQRMDLIDDIFKAYDRCCDEQDGVIDALLLCAVPPSGEQKKKMETFLCRKYGAESARIEVRQDPALLGGFILRTGCDEYDWSVRGRLDRLRSNMTRR